MMRPGFTPRRLLGALVIVSGVIAGPLAVSAHHGWGAYDSGTLVELTGTVQEVMPGNPHAMLRLQTTDKLWQIVLSPPARMQARGLPADTIRTGDTATVAGYVRADDPNELRAEWIRVGDTQISLR